MLPDPPNFALRTKTTAPSGLTLTRVEFAKHSRSRWLWVLTRYVTPLLSHRITLLCETDCLISSPSPYRLLLQIRLHSCGISTGTYLGTNPYNLNPALFKYNEAAVSLALVYERCRYLLSSRNALIHSPSSQWDIRDYVIYAAGQYGLRIVLPLTDN